MANEFVARKGLISQNNTQITGSLTVTQNVQAQQFYLPVSSSILANTTSYTPPHTEGMLFWDASNHTYGIYSDISTATLQVGQETWMRVVAGEYIPDGYAVYISKSISTNPIAYLAIADGTRTKSNVVGVATHNIASGSQGWLTTMGIVHDINTSLWTEGSILYLSDTVSGSYTTSPPSEPNEKVIVGTVIVQNVSNGHFIVGITKLSDLYITNVGSIHVPSIMSSSLTPTGSIITIGTGSVNFCTTADGNGVLRNYQLQSASFAVDYTFLDARYIVARYNSGSPAYSLVTDKTSVDNIQSTLIYTLLPGAGGIISYSDWDSPGTLLANKDNARVTALRGVERESGFDLGESGSRYITLTEGKAWQGIKQISLPAINSSTNRVVLIAHSASVWSGSIVTQYINDRYDDGTNLVTLGAGNHWVTNWIYRGIGSLNSTLIQLSNDYIKLSDAIAGQPPTPPPELKDVSILIGRAIYKSGESTATQIDSAFNQVFVPAGITNHNSLDNLQGGTSGEYYHLTSASYSQIANGTSSYAKTASYFGSGTNNYIPIWNNNSLTATSSIYQSGSNVGIGKTNPTVKLEVGGTTATDIIRIDNGLDFNPVLVPTDVTLELISGSGNVNTGSHYYYCSYYTSIGETELPVNGGRPNITTTTESGSVLVTFPTSSDYRVVGRKLYRGTANSGYYTPIRLLATITNNTQSTFIDNVSDASLTGTNYFYNENSTCKYITTNNVKSMFLSANNTAFGYAAGNNIGSTAQTSQCALFGYYAGVRITTGVNNTCIGHGTGYLLTTGGDNTFVGCGTGQSTVNGGTNTVIGKNAFLQNVSGDRNTIVGTAAAFGTANTSIYYNTMVGYYAGFSVSSSAHYNTLIGYYAGYGVKSGTNNICLGQSSGYNLNSGSNNIIIGNNVDVPVNGGSNQLNIANLIFASGSAFGTGTQVSTGSNVGIGTNKPSARLEISGSNINESLLKIQNSTGTSSLFASSSGYVGINTITPRRHLDINTSTANEGLVAGNTYIGNSGFIGQPHAQFSYLGTQFALIHVNSGQLIINSTTTQPINFRVNNTDMMIVTGSSGGRVGIGTITPFNKLDVAGNISCSVITCSLNALDVSAGISRKTDNYTLTLNDYTILMSGSVGLTASLPSATTTNGRIYNIKNLTNNPIYITGSHNIDSDTFMLLTMKNSNVTLQSDGTQWFIL